MEVLTKCEDCMHGDVCMYRTRFMQEQKKADKTTPEWIKKFVRLECSAFMLKQASDTVHLNPEDSYRELC